MNAEAGPMNPMIAAFTEYETTPEFAEAVGHVKGVTKPSAILLWAFKAGWSAANLSHHPRADLPGHDKTMANLNTLTIRRT